MIIFRGKREARIKVLTEHEYTCQACGAQDMAVAFYLRYFHIFWIPTFPLGKKTISIHCSNCGRYVVSEPIEKKYAKAVRTPIYFYTVPILFTTLILWGFYHASNEEKQQAALEAKLIEAPQAGDIYTLYSEKTGAGQYTFLRISEVRGDTVFAYPCQYAYNGYVTQMDSTDFFSKDDEIAFMQHQLKKMYNERVIRSIKRAYPNSSYFNHIR